MAQLDPFSRQIIEMVRNMPDEAILALVRNQLGLVGASGSTLAAPRAGARPKKAASKRRAKGKKRARASSAEREQLLAKVERVITTSKGLSASQIAKKAKLPQSRVAAAVRDLKEAKRVFQGGDRRFARYAGDLKTALRASTDARENASGPRTKR
jgi:ribosomal protein S25